MLYYAFLTVFKSYFLVNVIFNSKTTYLYTLFFYRYRSHTMFKFYLLSTCLVYINYLTSQLEGKFSKTDIIKKYINLKMYTISKITIKFQKLVKILLKKYWNFLVSFVE